MTKEEALKFISDTLRDALSKKFVGEPISEEKLRAKVHESFQEFVNSLFILHHIDFHEHINLDVVQSSEDSSKFTITMTPKTKTGTAILLEWQRRGAI